MSDTEQSTIQETTVTVVEETSAHRTFRVPASDVSDDEVSLENAELVDEGIHGDPYCYRRKDTNKEVEVNDG